MDSAAGRTRNTRPRDALGRPLPHGSTGVPPVPEDLPLSAAQTLAEAQRLLDAGQPFNAHEVLERAWKSTSDDERGLWRGMAQLVVGLTHMYRDNSIGAVRLLRRAAEQLAPYTDRPPHQIPVPALRQWAADLAGRIEGSSEGPMWPMPRLTHGH